MSPVVIDAKKKRQYAGLFAVSIIASFALGFGSGFFINQRQESQSYDELKSEVMNQSTQAGEKSASEASETDSAPDEDADSKTGDKEETAEKKTGNRDVPVKKAEKNVHKTAPDTAPEKPADRVALVTSQSRAESAPKPKPAPKPAPKPKPKPEPKPEPKPVAKPQPQPEPEPVAAVQPESSSLPMTPPSAPVRPPPDNGDGDAVTSSRGEPLAPMTPPDSQREKPAQKKSRTFAVQVGLFANRDNAQKLVYELIDRGYDAYMESFVASDGEVKYNVRFGRYPDRASVQRGLADYKQHYATSAYIIITQ